jgi:hypothetical protein
MADKFPPPPDLFCTPICVDALATEIEAAHKALEEARAKELREYNFFCLEKQTATEISEYHQWRWQKKLAANMPNHTLNFDTPQSSPGPDR